MAKVKFDFKRFALEKGEKIVLGLALAGLGLFIVMGISHFVSAESPVAKSNEFKLKTAEIQRNVERPEGDPGIKPLDPILMAPPSFKPIDPRFFESPYLPFEPVDHPSDKRDNPAVLGITDAQADLVRAPLKAYEVLVNGDQILIGVLRNVKIDPADVSKMKGFLDDFKKKNKTRSQIAGGAQAPAPAPASAPPQATPMMPPGRGRPPGAAANNGTRTEKSLGYVPIENFDEETKKDGVIPALSVYPIRMVVVHAAFPLKEQLEVIRRALRLPTIEAAEKETAPPGGGRGPTFLGFEVERKITAPNGQVYDWTPYDYKREYLSKIAIRKFADQPDDGLLAYFLRYDQKMAMPLPALAANLAIYPDIRLEAIIRGYKKLQDANKKPETASDLEKKFKGAESDNPFMPSSSVAGTGFGNDAAAQGIDRRLENRTGRPNTPPPAPGSPVVPSNMPELEHMMIRFLDVDVRPGFTYQYRVRVKMKNPNLNSKLVARPDDAKQVELFGPWVPIANLVRVPVDQNLYAGDPIAYAEKIRREFPRNPKIVDVLDNKNGELPVVQFQKWTELVPIESGKSEPAGYWVVAEVPVNRGEYVGHRQLVPLPMWSSEKVAFILQELPKYSVKGTNEKPKGLMVDFTTPMMLVDFEGGKVKAKVGDRIIEDEADEEIMLLKPDASGNLNTVMVRNSRVDKENAERRLREDAWLYWLKEIRDASSRLGQPGNGGGNPNDLFNNPPRPGPGG